MPTKQLIILGGPNGAGKSSAHTELERIGFVTGPFLNPDDVEQGRVRFVDGSRSPWLLPALEGLPRTETAAMPRTKALALARHHERLPRHWRG